VARIRRGVGLRLLVGVLLFSSAVTLVLTLLQLYLDYRHDVGAIERRLNEIEQGYLGAIGENLWRLDQPQLRLELEGILRLPDMRAAEVREIADANPLVVAVGERGTRWVMAREVPIIHVAQGSPRQIGTLYVEATLADVYRQLVDKALVILASQGAKTFLVSLFIIYFFHRLVTRHLVAFAEFVRSYDFHQPAAPLRLQRRPPATADELDQVVASFNGLCASLQRAYDDLRKVNADLELDIAARRQVEEALRKSEQRFRDYAEIASDWFWETGPDHRFSYLSERVANFGFDPVGLIGRRRWELAMDLEEEPEKWRRHFALLERHEPFRGFVYKITRADGSPGFAETSGKPIFDAAENFTGYRGGARDMTAQHETEAQLQQAQKMAAVGQLTGGVAHDFNNLLTVVIGSLDLALDHVQGETRAIVETAVRASQKAANLVHRLLAFSRRQTLRPETLDLNRLTTGMEDLLRRTVGAHFDIAMKLEPGLWPASADRGQVESALLNLTINARDAMPEGGRLLIETANKRLDEVYVAHNNDVAVGDYVVLAVTDTGTGMPPDVLERALEPFFTTKEIGKGSGLGLSVIYGFAKQSRGHLKIYSEVGHGTTVRLYLPRAAAAGVEAVARPSPAAHARGDEVILVVEDHADVRSYVVAQLRDLGYRVIEAEDGPQALKILGSDAPVDLLMTDMVMPGGMTGRQLAEAAKRQRPRVKLLFTSGHSEDAVVEDSELDSRVQFLAKPYTRQDLALKVRAVLETPD
ncbi:MAG TPA: ATP-binding protein, partial [Stellaceae bacterium]|nr:ATP-binding protein [Stellaceae bacterium]